MKGSSFEGLAKLADVFFNGRQADKPEPVKTITIGDLVVRGVSTVRYGKKFYRVTVEEIEIGKKA